MFNVPNQMDTISSYDTNIMLAAIISLLVVILFILLLHIYAKFHFTFTSISPSPSPSSSSSTSLSLPPSTLIIHHNFHSPSKGLDPSLVASIPLFIFEENDQEREKRSEECVICLSVFEADEVGRKLKKCGHCFHVDCIDMWLSCHLNCPICRAPAAAAKEEDCSRNNDDQIVILDVNQNEINGDNDDLNVINYDSLSSSSSSLGCSLMRILSGNRSEGSKVFPRIVPV